MEEACGKVGFEIRRLDHTISRTIEAWVKAEGDRRDSADEWMDHAVFV